jgi:hypothetical protein
MAIRVAHRLVRVVVTGVGSSGSESGQPASSAVLVKSSFRDGFGFWWCW